VTNLLNGIIILVGCAMVLYHLVSTQFVLWSTNHHIIAHLGFALTLIFLSTARKIQNKNWIPLVLTFMVGGIAVTSYMLIRYPHLELSIGFIREPIDWVVGILLVILVIEACREAWGIIFPTLAIIAILYFSFGHYLPYPFRTTNFPDDYILSNLGMGFKGILGTTLEVSANYMFLFIIFGALLGIAGSPRFFIEISKLPSRLLAGGAAQTAVVSSALVGMVTGQSISNVVLTGSFTIPFMKKAGYTPEQAGAIEATASTGGQVMPPVMGVAVFLMASLLGVHYIEIALASFYPAFLYFLSIAFSVQIIAYKNRLKSPKESLDMGEVVRWGPLFLIPLGVIFSLLLLRYTPMYAAFWAIMTVIGVSLFRKETRMPFMKLARGFGDGAVEASKIGISLAVIGIVVQTFHATGLGVTIAQLVESMSGGYLVVALLLSMVLALILGCGLPTIAAYAIVAIVIVPVMVKMGVSPLSGHLFVFWFAIVSAVTPPVAFAAMAGAAIAKADFWKTGVEAFKLAISGFLVPWVIIVWPSVTLQSQPLGQVLTGIIALPMALLALSIVMYNHFFVRIYLWERVLFILVLSLFTGFFITKVYAFFIPAVILEATLIIWQRKRWKARERFEPVMGSSPYPG